GPASASFPPGAAAWPPAPRPAASRRRLASSDRTSARRSRPGDRFRPPPCPRLPAAGPTQSARRKSASSSRHALLAHGPDCAAKFTHQVDRKLRSPSLTTGRPFAEPTRPLAHLLVSASAPSLATCASCSEAAPDTPTAPTIFPSTISGIPPSGGLAPLSLASSGSWGGRCPSLADYVTVRGAADGRPPPAAAGGC